MRIAPTASWRRTISSSIVEALQLLLHLQGYAVDGARSPAEVRAALASEFYDALLIDLNYTRDTTSGQEGLDLLSEIVALDSTVPVIVMTAWGNVELAVEAMRRGARDFITKPWENERLLAILRTQIELHRALQRAERLPPLRTGCCKSRSCRSLSPRQFPCSRMKSMARVGPSDANVAYYG